MISGHSRIHTFRALLRYFLTHYYAYAAKHDLLLRHELHRDKTLLAITTDAAICHSQRSRR